MTNYYFYNTKENKVQNNCSDLTIANMLLENMNETYKKIDKAIGIKNITDRFVLVTISQDENINALIDAYNNYRKCVKNL